MTPLQCVCVGPGKWTVRRWHERGVMFLVHGSVHAAGCLDNSAARESWLRRKTPFVLLLTGLHQNLN